MTNFEIARDLVLLTLGAVGTGLSIYNLFELRGRGLRRVKVTLEYAIPTYSDGSLGEEYVRVMAVNSGHRDVTLSNLGLELPQKKTLALLSANNFPGLVDSAFPAKLTDGDVAHRYYPMQSLNDVLGDGEFGKKVRIRPFAVDSAGKRHYGKHFFWQDSD